MIKFPQPTQDELDHEDTHLQTYNPYWWELWQGFIGSLANPDRWDDYEAVEGAISELMLSDEIINADWFAVFDFRIDNGGFSVVTGEGGTWVSGGGWEGTNVGTDVQIHIERNFGTTSGVSGFLIFYSTVSGVQYTRELSLKVRVGGADTTWYLTNPSATGGIREIMVDGSIVNNVTRLRIKNYQSGGSAANAKIQRLLIWGDGLDPFA